MHAYKHIVNCKKKHNKRARLFILFVGFFFVCGWMETDIFHTKLIMAWMNYIILLTMKEFPFLFSEKGKNGI